MAEELDSDLHREDLERVLDEEGMKVSSPALEEGGEIPMHFTCEGANVSPPLRFSEPPAGTKSLVVVVDDWDAPAPRAPRKRFVHWLLYNLPPTTRELPQGVTAEALPPGTRVGKNDFGNDGYEGPCPPVGRHRYFFSIFALDVVLDAQGALTRDEVLTAARGHVLAQGELVATYQKVQTRH